MKTFEEIKKGCENIHEWLKEFNSHQSKVSKHNANGRELIKIIKIPAVCLLLLLTIGLQAQDFNKVNALNKTFNDATEIANSQGFYRGKNFELNENKEKEYFEGYSITGFGTVKYFYTENGKGKCYKISITTSNAINVDLTKFKVEKRKNIAFQTVTYTITLK